MKRPSGAHSSPRRPQEASRSASASRNSSGSAGRVSRPESPRSPRAFLPGHNPDQRLLPPPDPSPESTRPTSWLSAFFAAAGRFLENVRTALSNFIRPLLDRFPSLHSALVVLFSGVALFSLFMIGRIVYRSVVTARLNRDLAALHTQAASGTIEEGEVQVYTGEVPPENPTEGQETEGSALPPAQTTQTDLPLQADPQPQSEEPPPEPEPETSPEPVPESEPTPGVSVVSSTRYHQVGGDALPQMVTLHEKNRDLIGWLNIPGVIDLPVVFRNNSYYLTHDFYGNKNTSGTLFLDENHPLREKSQNLLLHGHNMRDGSMFGRLAQYEASIGYLKSHPVVNFSTLWKEETYVVFAVLRVSLDTQSSKFFNYFTHMNFSTDEEFNIYTHELQNRSLYMIPVDTRPSDALLTLSTCLDDDRLVVVCRRLRPGESKSDLASIVRTATRQ